jgi:hypothetical protein
MAESLRPFPEKLPFCRDYWWRRVRSRLPPDLGTHSRLNLGVSMAKIGSLPLGLPNYSATNPKSKDC